jgi:rubrerythrin
MYSLYMGLMRRGYHMFSIGDIIDLAVQIEKNAERLFRDAAKETADPGLASMLQWLADEEIQHAERFSDLKQEAQETVEDPGLEEMGKAILEGTLGGQTFSLKDVDLSSIEGVDTLLRQVIEFENDTILFYEMIKSFVEDEETVDHLEKIIEEEESHIRVLEEFLGEEGDKK